MEVAAAAISMDSGSCRSTALICFVHVTTQPSYTCMRSNDTASALFDGNAAPPPTELRRAPRGASECGSGSRVSPCVAPVVMDTCTNSPCMLLTTSLDTTSDHPARDD